MRACCARSALTAPRPISTPTSRRITTSTSRTTTNWSTFRTRIWCCRRCRKCPKATRSPGSTWSCGCARSAEPFSDLRIILRNDEESVHLLVGVDTPQPLLFDPAVEAVADDAAPACATLLELGHDAGLQA